MLLSEDRTEPIPIHLRQDHVDETSPHTVGVAKSFESEQHLRASSSTHSPSELRCLCPDENYFLSMDIHLDDQ